MAAMRAEGRLGDEMYLTQFAFEEAKHTQVFRLWLDAVGVTDDLHPTSTTFPSYGRFLRGVAGIARHVVNHPRPPPRYAHRRRTTTSSKA